MSLLARIPRRARVLLGLAGALVLLVVLVAPVALRGGAEGGSCARALRYAGRSYTARPLGGAGVVQSIAIGTGVVSGCGEAPANVDVRSVAGIRPAFAVALPTETETLYVAHSRCPGREGTALLRCLRGEP
ncbi:MAG: hypothetical protein IRZ20_08480 [Thermoleophilia bacterium]|nr:hypothetical protein [Thermoleophilia bacterium]